MISQIHQVRGRLRINIPQMKQEQIAMERLRRRLVSIQGVLQVDCNIVTGSVTIRFDEGATTAGDLINSVTAFLGVRNLVGFPKRSLRPTPVETPKPQPALNDALKLAIRIVVPVLVGRYFGKPAGNLVAALL